MNEHRLGELLGGLARARVLVVGDFFLDRYLLIDAALAETSIETGLTAHQVADVVATPGAAGTVAANLRALGAHVTALGVVGDDGEGYELRRGLRALGVDDATLVLADGRRTPTYTKPMLRDAAGARELERLDIRTRAALPAEVEARVIERLRALAPRADAIVVADQMPEAEHGVVTARVRDALAELAAAEPTRPFLADSRARIGLFRRLIAKPNLHECLAAVGAQSAGTPLEQARAAGSRLMSITGQPVLVTLGADGVLVVREGRATHVAGVPVAGPIDVVGAGDSAMAAIAAGLCAGATLEEAALLGNLAAAVTIRQIGATGTASPEQLRAQHRALRAD